MFCLLIHIKCFVGIYFIENKIFAKRSFSNYEPSKMVFHFFKFFTFSCFRGTFVKNFMKKLSFFNANFWKSIQDLFAKFYDLKPAATKIRILKAAFINVLTELFLETLWKKTLSYFNTNFQRSYEDLQYWRLSRS